MRAKKPEPDSGPGALRFDRLPPPPKKKAVCWGKQIHNIRKLLNKCDNLIRGAARGGGTSLLPPPPFCRPFLEMASDLQNLSIGVKLSDGL